MMSPLMMLSIIHCSMLLLANGFAFQQRIPTIGSFRSEDRLSMKLFERGTSDSNSCIRINRIAAISLLTIPLSICSVELMTNVVHQHSVTMQPSSVLADVRAQQKKTYFRFAPKLNEGKEFYRVDLKEAIDKGNWDVVSKFFAEYVSKVNKNDPGQVQTDTFVNNNLYRPMTLLSGTFAERGSSIKTRLLLDEEAAFSQAMASLEGCVKDIKGEGFFAPTTKMPTGEARTKQVRI